MNAFSKRRALHTPSSVQGRHFVGIWLFIELHRRVFKGKFGSLPESLKDDAFNMSAYCLDAPSTLPCGSVAYERFGPEEDEWLAAPTTVERDEL